MDAHFLRQFLWQTLRTLVVVSPFAVWSALRKVQPRPRPEWATWVSQPVATVILFAVVAMLIYSARRSPDMLGLMAAMFLTIPLERLIVLVNKRAVHPAHTSKP